MTCRGIVRAALVLVLPGLAVCSAQDTPELGVPGSVLAPIQHLPFWRLEREQFGYRPRFVPGVTTFDLHNRPFVRAGRVLQTLDEHGQWVETELADPVLAAYPDWDGAFATGPFAEEHVAFDADGDAYTIVNATRSSLGQALLLHSGDGGRSWRPHPIGAGFARMERLDGHNDFTYPPPILLMSGPGRSHLDLIVPVKRDDGALDVSTRVRVSEESLLVSNHSGGGNSLCSQGDLVHIVWPGRTPVPGRDGTPQLAATYDRRAGTLTEPVLLGFGGSGVPDPHNLPAIAADSRGVLHVVLGAHHDPFHYTRSLEPRSVTGGWTEPVAFGEPKRSPQEGSYTYAGWVCGPDDTLHCVSRWAGAGYFFRLSYMRKPRDGDWELRPHLVIPFGGNYSVYYHKLNIDRRGRLLVNYVYTRAARFPDEVAAHTKKHPLSDPDAAFINKEPCLLVSDDGGDTWRLAVTADLDPDGERPAEEPYVAAPEAEPPTLPADLLKQLGGAFGPVAVEGDLAAVGVGKSLVLLDISDPDRVRVAGQGRPLGDQVMDVRLRPPHAYVAAWRDGLVVYDISEPARPRVVAHDPSTEGRGFRMVADTLYLTAAAQGLRILDISRPDAPREIGRVRGMEAYDVEVLGSWAYVATGAKGLKLVDVGDPAAPRAVADLFTPAGFAYSDRVNTAWSLTRDGETLYISPGPSDVCLRIFDLADPERPRELAQVHQQPWGWGRATAVQAGRLFFAGLNGLHVLDVSDPTAPVELASLPEARRGVAARGHHVYAAGADGLTAYDMTDPRKPRRLGGYQAPRLPFDVAVSGDRGYVADWNAGVHAFDLSDPDLPQPLGLHAGEKWALGVAADERHVYVAAGREGMVVLDAADPGEMTVVGRFPSETGVRAVAVHGQRAYLAEAEVGVRVVDITDPARPRSVAVFPAPREVLGLEVGEGHLYLAEAQWLKGGLRVLEMDEEGGLREVGLYECDDDVWAVTVADGWAALSLARGGLRVLDVRDPQAPRMVGRLDLPGAAWGAAVVDDRLYVASGTDGLTVVQGLLDEFDALVERLRGGG